MKSARRKFYRRHVDVFAVPAPRCWNYFLLLQTLPTEAHLSTERWLRVSSHILPYILTDLACVNNGTPSVAVLDNVPEKQVPNGGVS
ncbi:hypothetical protein CEXT_739611 [Caerostris extrusa]|uniref:Uncharacterized protein n=1 Tax=Caerostris extrusa TaxID=172846 RepID=A0AAV4VVS7_CAEEX|nr:hypothetical protein CEXT_739611 [Caerostris extrusa]